MSETEKSVEGVRIARWLRTEEGKLKAAEYGKVIDDIQKETDPHVAAEKFVRVTRDFLNASSGKDFYYSCSAILGWCVEKGTSLLCTKDGKPIVSTSDIKRLWREMGLESFRLDTPIEIENYLRQEHRKNLEELESPPQPRQGETPGARDEVKSAYRFGVKEQDVWCNDRGPFKAEPRLSAILGELINNPEVEVKMKRLQTVSRLDSRVKVREAVRDLVCWLKDTFKIDIKILDKMFEPVRGKNRKYTGYIYHPNIS